MKRNFEQWLDTMTDFIASWDYYTDFDKVYKNANKFKVELNILNSLIGSQNIKQEFLMLIQQYPTILKVIPLLLAKRMNSSKESIAIKDTKQNFYFNFLQPNYSSEEYAQFMEKTGLFDLLEQHLVSNLYDYVLGIEVGLDSNARKNRTGHAMENLVQTFLEDAGFIMGKTMFKEIYQDEVENKYGLDLSKITNYGKTQKRFDFVLQTATQIYLLEVNFYSSGGSKLNETARSYKMITEEVEEIPNVSFVWITDGQGWKNAKNNLRETFEVLDNLYNINDLQQGVLKKLK